MSARKRSPKAWSKPRPDAVLEKVRAAAVAGVERGERASRIAAAVRQAGGHRWVGVYEVTETQVAVLGWAGPGAPAYPRFDRTQGLTAAAVAGGSTVVVDDVTEDPRYLTAFGSTRSEMIVPVLDAALRGGDHGFVPLGQL